MPLPLLALLTVAWSLLSGCTSQTVWNRLVSTVESDLRAGRHAFLGSVDLTVHPPAEAFRLGEEAPYYLAEAFRGLNQTEKAETMLRILVERGTPFWRGEALLELLAPLVEAEHYDAACALAAPHLTGIEGSRHADRIARLFVESLYWQRKDARTLEALQELFSPEAIEEHAELSLFRAVTTYRIGRPEWPELFRRLFTAHRVSSVHIRAHAFLSGQTGALESAGPMLEELWEGKHLLATGQYGPAVERLRKVISGMDASELTGSPLVRELGIGFLHAGINAPGAEYLEELSARLGPAERLTALEMAGRLYRKAGRFDRAIRLLRRVASDTPDLLQRDRCLWFILEMSLDISWERTAAELERSAPLWTSPPYFDDLMDRLIDTHSRSADPEGLSTLYGLIRDHASPYAVRRLAFHLLRLHPLRPGAGAPAPEPGALPPHPGLMREDVSFNALVRTLYYDTLISEMVGSPPALLSFAAPKLGRAPVPAPPAAPAPLDAMALFFFDYGLFDAGYAFIAENAGSLAVDTLRRGALALGAGRHHPQAMRLMNTFLVNSPEPPTPADWRTAYPLAYGDRIERLAGKHEIPLYLLYAVVREESYFDPKSSSRASASGLMQLMPATAEEMAGRLDMQSYDLDDPEDNLRLGTEYLSWLHMKMGTWTRTLMAYNAGPTRVRRWIRRSGAIPDVMMVERFPFAETRHYVRKIMVTTILYSLLYTEDIGVSEAVALFFPSLP